MMLNRIAILGWGSLLWDAKPDFDAHHTAWQRLGPCLPIEFSRISLSRKGALTLVIDRQHGTPMQVSYSLSTRRNLGDTIEDLRAREGTTQKSIGAITVGEISDAASGINSAICRWAAANDICTVVWTNLPSNFQEQTGKAFTIANAISYLRGLEDGAQHAALEYIRNAPDFVQTPLRAAVADQIN